MVFPGCQAWNPISVFRQFSGPSHPAAPCVLETSTAAGVVSGLCCRLAGSGVSRSVFSLCSGVRGRQEGGREGGRKEGRKEASLEVGWRWLLLALAFLAWFRVPCGAAAVNPTEELVPRERCSAWLAALLPRRTTQHPRALATPPLHSAQQPALGTGRSCLPAFQPQPPAWLALHWSVWSCCERMGVHYFFPATVLCCSCSLRSLLLSACVGLAPTGTRAQPCLPRSR